MHIGRGVPSGRLTGLRSTTTTGHVWSDVVLDEVGVRCLTMYFAPGSRTYWHSHKGGQFLYTIAGEGWIQDRNGIIERLGPGDMCWSESGAEHWHGASADSQLIQVVLHFGDVEWGAAVTDDEYQAPRQVGPEK